MSEAEISRIFSHAKAYVKDDTYPEGRSRAGILIEELAREGRTHAADSLRDVHNAMLGLASGELLAMRKLIAPNDSMPGQRIDDQYHEPLSRMSDDMPSEKYTSSIGIITRHMDEAVAIIIHDRFSKSIDWDASAVEYKKYCEAEKARDDQQGGTWEQSVTKRLSQRDRIIG